MPAVQPDRHRSAQAERSQKQSKRRSYLRLALRRLPSPQHARPTGEHRPAVPACRPRFRGTIRRNGRAASTFSNLLLAQRLDSRVRSPPCGQKQQRESKERATGNPPHGQRTSGRVCPVLRTDQKRTWVHRRFTLPPTSTRSCGAPRPTSSARSWTWCLSSSVRSLRSTALHDTNVSTALTGTAVALHDQAGAGLLLPTVLMWTSDIAWLQAT